MPPTDLFRVPCPTCGSQMRFSAEKQQLSCSHCGNTQAIPLTRQNLEERSLTSYQVDNHQLPNAPTEEKLVFSCPNCGAQTTINTDEPTITCAFCGTKSVNPDARKTRLIEPAGVLPFKVSKEQAIERFKGWVGDDWLAPSDLKAGARPDNFHGVYVPFWTFDAQAYSDWYGEAGFYYNVTVQVPDGKGGMMRQQEQRVRWEPRNGSHSQFYDDILIMASKQLTNQADSVAEASSYNLTDVVDYDPRFLLGWDAEVYSIDLPESARQADADIRRREEYACSSQLGGNVQRNLNVNTQLSNQTFKHILLPLWICAYVYNGKAYRFLVNGQTGRIAGERPKSAWKIALLIIGFLLLVLFFYSIAKK